MNLSRTIVVIGIVIMQTILALTTAEAALPAPDTPVALPEGVSQDWWTQVQQNIQASEYHITWQDQTALADLPAAYQAPNRAQNFRTYFTENGIHVIPRATAYEAPAWEWGLHLTGYGYADAPDLTGFPKSVRSETPLIPATAPTTNGNRVEYRRGSLLVEGPRNDIAVPERRVGCSLTRCARESSSHHYRRRHCD